MLKVESFESHEGRGDIIRSKGRGKKKERKKGGGYERRRKRTRERKKEENIEKVEKG